MSREIIHDLDMSSGLILNLQPGMAFAIYSDEGPGGPCGQSMLVTCPHTVIHVWDNEDCMRRDVASGGLMRNKKSRLEYGVVGLYTASGVVRVVEHKEARQ